MGINKTPKVSVIVPIYKAEKFIERCCVSLFEQTLDDMEFIFVDDCSPDNSIAMIRDIMKRYPNREPQIKILTHTPNRGVSFTRQQGFEAATGEFVIHCDSDDWVELDMYESMYNTAIIEDADVVCCGYSVEYANGRKQDVLCNKENLCSKVVFNLAPQTGSLCSKIVRLSNLRNANVSFPQDTNWGEDFCVSIAGLVLSKKTVVLDSCFYHYWQNTDSITHTISKTKCLELTKVPQHVEEFLLSAGLLQKYKHQLNYLKFQSKAVLLRDKGVRDIKLWKSIYPECHYDIFSYRYPLYFKIASWFISHNMTAVAKPILLLKDSRR